MVLLCGALGFLALALVMVTRPAPSLKIDKFLTAVHVRMTIRRARKRALRRMHIRERDAPDSTISRAESKRYCSLLKAGKLEEVTALRRTAQAAHSAGNALGVVGAVMGADCVNAIATTLEHAAGHGIDQASHNAETAVEDALRGAIGEQDIAGETGGGFALQNLAGGGANAGISSARGAACGTVVQLLSQVNDLFNPGQFKILMGNLQINASLTVVFSIPWPPIHTQFIELLNVFKLDVFKGLSFAAPCLHSTHFMSVATFVATPIVLVGVFAVAYAIAAIGICFRSLCCSSSRRRGPCTKLCCAYTLSSARIAALKVAIVVILFIYPTICSKVFMTFKCVDVGASGSFWNSVWNVSVDPSESHQSDSLSETCG
jgi:hypothetical protein